MMDIKENIIFLRAIVTLPKKQVKDILKGCTVKQLSVLGQIANNVLSNNLKIKEKFKSALKRHRKVIRSLAQIKMSHKQKTGVVVNNTSAVITLILSVIETLTLLIK